MRLVQIFSLLIFAGWGAVLNAKDIAYARQSPLTTYPSVVVKEVNPAGAVSRSVKFGEPLEVLEFGAQMALLRLQDGTTSLVDIKDLFIPRSGHEVLPGPNFEVEDRVMLSFWDSFLRASGFLQTGPTPETQPLVREIGVGSVGTSWPVSSVAQVKTSIGSSVTIAESMVPISYKAMNYFIANKGKSTKDINFHILIDGSSYAGAFSQERLRVFSRSLDESEEYGNLNLHRTILFQDGNTRGPEHISISGLREIFPQSTSASTSDDELSDSLMRGLFDTKQKINNSSNSNDIHIVIILLGPTIREEFANNEDFKAMVGSFQQIYESTKKIGFVFGSATPEPSEIPRLITSNLLKQIPSYELQFTETLNSSVVEVLEKIMQTESDASVEMDECELSRLNNVPCFSNDGLNTLSRFLDYSSNSNLDWIGVNLWHIVDNNTLVLEKIPEILVSEGLTGNSRGNNQELFHQREKVFLEEIKNKDVEISDLRAQADELTKEFLAIQNRARKHQQEFEEFQSDYRTLEEGHVYLQMQYASEQKAHVESQLQLRDVLVNMELIDEEVRILESALASVVEEKSALEGQSRQLRSEVFELSDQLEELESDNGILRDRVNSLYSEVNQLTSSIELLEQEKLVLVNSLSAAKFAEGEQDILIRNLRGDLDRTKLTSDKESERLHSQLQEMVEENKFLNTELGKKDLALNKFEDEKWELETSLTELQAKYEASQRAAITLKDEMKEQAIISKQIADENGGLTALLEQRTAELQKSQETFQAIMNIAAIDVSDEELPAVVARSTQALKAAEARIELLEGQNTSLKEKVGLALTRVEQKEQEISTLQNGSKSTLEKLAMELSDIKEEHATELLALQLQVNELLVTKSQLEMDLEDIMGNQQSAKQRKPENYSNLEIALATKEDEILKLKDSLAKLREENGVINQNVEIAKGVAEENIQLISIIQNAEKKWFQREAVLESEINLLNQKLAAYIDHENLQLVNESVGHNASATARTGDRPLVVSLRPAARPESFRAIPPPNRVEKKSDRKPESTVQRSVSRGSVATNPPSPPPNALPGSLFVQTRPAQLIPDSGSQTGGGFFGN